jgi:hypothetical protein
LCVIISTIRGISFYCNWPFVLSRQ